MTTIAYKDGILAADSQITNGTFKYKGPPKITVINKGLVVALCGELNGMLGVQRFFEKPNWKELIEEYEKLGKKNAGIIFIEGNIFLFDGILRLEPLCSPYFALGSGATLAMGAMALGLSATEAVKFASTMDTHTNDDVQSVNLKELQNDKKLQKKPSRN